MRFVSAGFSIQSASSVFLPSGPLTQTLRSSSLSDFRARWGMRREEQRVDEKQVEQEEEEEQGKWKEGGEIEMKR